jgi:hypothetical protein
VLVFELLQALGLLVCVLGKAGLVWWVKGGGYLVGLWWEGCSTCRMVSKILLYTYICYKHLCFTFCAVPCINATDMQSIIFKLPV